LASWLMAACRACCGVVAVVVVWLVSARPVPADGLEVADKLFRNAASSITDALMPSSSARMSVSWRNRATFSLLLMPFSSHAALPLAVLCPVTVGLAKETRAAGMFIDGWPGELIDVAGDMTRLAAHSVETGLDAWISSAAGCIGALHVTVFVAGSCVVQVWLALVRVTGGLPAKAKVTLA
jgi:hypothetical protein